ncbi:PREDICTED: NANOG neighbor homeobox [Condylura cristata]|uniref:NANOG neighbor homeobox n=1 Tax=Condylura cristata TaxID=143302 RepID=UPI0006435536|nr:PREDICTED: NANOG neighbor homeobox [Condylura cristata]
MPGEEAPEPSTRHRSKERSGTKRSEQKEKNGQVEQYPQTRLISKPLMNTLWTKFKLRKYLTIGDRLSLAFEFSLTDKQISQWFCEKREKYKEEIYKQKYKKKHKKLVKDALLTDKIKIKEQLAECENVFNEVQEEQVATSLKDEDSDCETKRKTKRCLRAPTPIRDTEGSTSLSEEESELEKGIEELEGRLKRVNPLAPGSTSPMTTAPPPYNPGWDPGTEKPIWVPERCTRPVEESSRQNEAPTVADPVADISNPSSECQVTPHALDPADDIPSAQVR